MTGGRDLFFWSESVWNLCGGETQEERLTVKTVSQKKKVCFAVKFSVHLCKSLLSSGGSAISRSQANLTETLIIKNNKLKHID